MISGAASATASGARFTVCFPASPSTDTPPATAIVSGVHRPGPISGSTHSRNATRGGVTVRAGRSIHSCIAATTGPGSRPIAAPTRRTSS